MIGVMLIFILTLGINGYDLLHYCANTDVLFPLAVSRSPIVIYGKSLAKQVYLQTDDEILFNITFRVDCLFKGESIEHRIEITQAGIRLNNYLPLLNYTYISCRD